MESNFLSRKHMEYYLDLVMEDHMHTEDMERASLFYIISGNDELYRKRRFIYDPKDHSIKRCLDNRKARARPLLERAGPARFWQPGYHSIERHLRPSALRPRL